MRKEKILIWIGVVLVMILSIYMYWKDITSIISSSPAEPREESERRDERDERGNEPNKQDKHADGTFEKYVTPEDDISLQAKRYQVIYDMLADNDELTTIDNILNYCSNMANTKMYNTTVTKEIPKRVRSDVLKCWQTNFPGLVVLRPSELVSDKNPQPHVPTLSQEQALKNKIIHDVSKINLSDLNQYLERAKTLEINLHDPYYLDNRNETLIQIERLERDCGDLRYLF